jgi:putative endonuclease
MIGELSVLCSAIALRQLAEVELKKMYVVYAIYNKNHSKIYIGQTTDLGRRLLEHNEHTLGGFTSQFDGLWEVIYQEELPTREEALKREKQLKSFRGREFVKKHILQ